MKIAKSTLKKIIKEELENKTVFVAGHERLKSRVMKDLAGHLEYLGQQSAEVRAGTADYETILTTLANSYEAIKGLKGKE